MLPDRDDNLSLWAAFAVALLLCAILGSILPGDRSIPCYDRGFRFLRKYWHVVSISLTVGLVAIGVAIGSWIF
jgi:hypothetical protein